MAVGAGLLVGCGKSDQSAGSGPSTAPSTSPKQLAVIAKSTVNAYWKAVEAGARKAEAEAHLLELPQKLPQTGSWH